ncbi:MAG: hypothetical protein WKG00_06280 [Polyangiaceae bacterium]
MIAGALLAALAVLVALGSAAMARAHLARVGAAFDGHPSLDRSALLRVPLADRAATAASRARPGGWVASLAAELEAARDDDERVVMTNDALGELARALEVGAGWSAAAVRVCLSATLLLAVAAFLLGEPMAALPVCAIGGIGALACAEIGRRARGLATRQRERADALVEVLLPDLAGRGRAAPARPSRRRRP